MSNFQLPSFYKFSTGDTTSTADYSKDAEVNDGIVDDPPTTIVNLTYVLSAFPLYTKKLAINAFKTPCHWRMTMMLIKWQAYVSTWNLPYVMFLLIKFLVLQTFPRLRSMHASMPFLPIIIRPPSLVPSMVGKFEFNCCFAHHQSGRHSSSFDPRNVVVAMFKTISPILEPVTNKPTTNIHFHFIFILPSSILVHRIVYCTKVRFC